MKSFFARLCLVVCLVPWVWSEARAQFESVPFVYQGSLKDGGVPANGIYQMIFEFYTVPTGGSPFLSVSNTSISVTNGVFSVTFTGGTTQFVPGGTVWIETSVRRADSTGAFTPLAPRQRVAYSPLAISSLLAGDAQRLGGVEAGQYLTTTAAANIFIQNGSTPQNGGFNLNGTGTASIVNATTQFNLGGSRILSAGGTDNIFAGSQAGQANTSGNNNSFFGVQAGGANTFGSFNSFFGRSAGAGNSGGSANSIFGTNAGSNSTGNRNTFFGFSAGVANTTGSFNTLLGSDADFGAGDLSNATALGYRAFVNLSNSLVLGSINGVNGATADTNVGIGTTSPAQRLQVVGNGIFSGNLGVGTSSPSQKLHILDNNANIVLGGLGCGTGFVGINFFGVLQSNSCVNYSVLGDGTSTYFNRSNSGWMFFRMANNDQMVLSPAGNVGIGLVNPSQRLQVEGNGAFSGWLSSNLDTAGATAVCRNTLGRLSSCSSSIRYKENVRNYSSGLDLVRRLRPVTFNWKANNEADFGLVAEETAAIEPLLVTYNDKGEVEGVKYDRVGVVLINAVSEQQTQIEAQQKQIDEQTDVIRRQQERLDKQQSQIDALKALVCANNRTAEVCQEKK